MPTAHAVLAQDLNRVVLSGKLADDPDLYDLAPAPTVCFLRLHCDRHDSPATLGEDGQVEVNVLLFGDYATKLSSHLHAGRQLAVDGALASAEWGSLGREPEQSVCVIAERIELLDAPGHPSPPSEAVAMVGFSDDAWC